MAVKDLAVKIDNMMTMMDQREERLLAAMEQRDDRIKLLEMSLQSISKFIEAQIVSNTVGSMENNQTMREDTEFNRS